MTRRVITFSRDLHALSERTSTARQVGPAHAPLQGLRTAVCIASIALPFAGAASAPVGWLTGLFALLALTLVAPLLGPGAPWGLFGALSGLLLLFTPHDQLGAGAPALIIAAVICATLWVSNHARSHPEGDQHRPAPGSVARAEQVRQGAAGEQFVTTQLSRELPDSYVLIAGSQLPHSPGDIDHLIVGPTGVFVVETKTMAGFIVCDDHGVWQRTRVGRGGGVYPAFIGDPAAQVQRNIFAVRQALQARIPQLFGTNGLWIEGLVVFAHPRSVIRADASRVPAVLVNDLVPRICAHQPRRALDPQEVDRVVDALVDAHGQRTSGRGVEAQRAQALVELALALPIVLGMIWGTVALSRIVTTEVGLIGLAHEVARAGALARSPSDAVVRMRDRLHMAAPGLGIDAATTELEYDVSMFADPDSPRVVAAVTARVDWATLPLVGWTDAPHLHAEHVEWIDPFRSGLVETP